MLKIVKTFRCGHTVTQYLNAMPTMRLEQKIVRLEDAQQKGLVISESIGNNEIKLALIDNYSNCPTCWEKAEEIEENPEDRKRYKEWIKAFEDALKKTIFTAITLMVIATATAGDLITAIGEVESRNNDQAVGDGGKAVGRYQIHIEVIEDVNASCGTSYSAADRTDPAKAREILEKYLAHWARHYERTQKKPATDEIKARIWNGGPSGWRKPATLPYWEKVKKAQDNGKQRHENTKSDLKTETTNDGGK